jgi:hypothetical protein
MKEMGEVVIFIAILCALLIAGLKIAGTYSASYFTEQTGLEAKCNVLSECYVKQDSSWIPYKVWALQQQGNKVQLIDSNK